MFEALKKAMFFGIGAAALSVEKLRQFVDELVAKGDITAEEGKKLYEEITTRADEERKSLNSKIRTQIRQTLADMGVADQTQIALLESKIDSLEDRIDRLDLESEAIED